jgi:transposase
VLDQRYSIAETSRSLDVGENALRRWVMQLSEERGGITPKSKALTLEQHQHKLAMEVNVYCLSS